MINCDLLIFNAGQVATCASGAVPKKGPAMLDAGIISDGAVAVKDGRIAAVGGSAELLAAFRPAESIDAGGRVVVPGFVECHTHLVYAGDRLGEFELKIRGADYLEILAAGGGIISTMRRTREASVDELVDLALPRLEKMARLGTTTCEVKTGYGLETATEFRMLEAILALDGHHWVDVVPTFLPAHAVPPEFRERPDDYVELICREMLPLAAERFDPSKIFVDVFCEKGAFDLGQSRRVLETARSLGFGIKAHVDEFTNLGGARLAIGLGAASIDHLDAISDEEADLLAASRTVGVVTPTVNFNLGSREFADARKLIDKGCAVAVSTDYNPGSAPCPSLPLAMAIACRYQKLLPAEALIAVTVNAAFAVGRGRETGSVEVGKKADLLVCDLKDHRELAYEFGGNPVLQVIKAGRRVSADGDWGQK